MNDNDPQFENFLRGFEPRRPRVLPSDSGSELQWRRLAAAAVLAVSLGSVAWFAFRSKREAIAPPSVERLARRQDDWPKLTLIQLTRLAEKDPRALDAELNEASRKSLPDFNEANSSLRALAKP